MATMLPTFGSAPADVQCHDRAAAYAVIWNVKGQVATVQAVVNGKVLHWLPGGGSHLGESAEDTIIREVEEELGRTARLVSRIGEAIQFFYAGDEDRWYRMTATFFQAVLEGPVCPAEYELHWLDPQQAHLFFPACHAWAVMLGTNGRHLMRLGIRDPAFR
jgi:8-oxo-dGTP pyrophosphatase MutT (NUDIX family)